MNAKIYCSHISLSRSKTCFLFNLLSKNYDEKSISYVVVIILCFIFHVGYLITIHKLITHIFSWRRFNTKFMQMGRACFTYPIFYNVSEGYSIKLSETFMLNNKSIKFWFEYMTQGYKQWLRLWIKFHPSQYCCKVVHHREL